jgi:hypothetical protein
MRTKRGCVKVLAWGTHSINFPVNIFTGAELVPQ